MNIIVIAAIAAGVFSGDVTSATTIAQDSTVVVAEFSGSAGALKGYEI